MLRPLLLLSILLAAALSRAQYAVTYLTTESGHSSYYGYDQPYYVLPDGSWGSEDTAASFSGTIKARFDWQGSGPPPPVAIVKEECSVYIALGGGGDYYQRTITAQADDDLGETDGPRSDDYGVGAGAGSTPKYTIKYNPGTTFYATVRSPSASLTPHPYGVIFSGLSYRAEATPVSIESNYAVRDESEGFNFLVGQQADFYVASGSYSQAPLHVWAIDSDYVGSVTFGSQEDNPNPIFGQYYEGRTTDYDFDAFGAHPSVYFEGDTVDDSHVTCAAALYDGTHLVGTVNVSRSYNVARPICLLTVTSTGPCTIFDENISSVHDEEIEEARDDSAPGSGLWVDGNLCLPTLFVSNQGEGTWSYVQLVSRAYSLDGSDPTIQPRGLDNSYPYAASYVRTPTYDLLATWRSTYGTGELSFYDAPSLGISGANSYSDSFHGDCYAVMRPPHWSGQSYVELPIAKQPWDYLSGSARSSGNQWIVTSSYTSFSNTFKTGWVTSPNYGALTPGSSQQPIESEDMDWSSVILNH